MCGPPGTVHAGVCVLSGTGEWGSGVVSRTEGWGFLGESWGQRSDLSLSAAQVQENSPAQQAGLEPYFDFIITIGHSRLVRPLSCLCCVCVSVYLSVCLSAAVPWDPQPCLPFLLEGDQSPSRLLPGQH